MTESFISTEGFSVELGPAVNQSMDQCGARGCGHPPRWAAPPTMAGSCDVPASSSTEITSASGSTRVAACSGRGSHGWKGRGPSAGDSTPSGRFQNIPIRASKGMTCPNLREIGSGRGRGFSLVVFPTPLLLV